MFTLFFAGRDFAPECIIDGVNIKTTCRDISSRHVLTSPCVSMRPRDIEDDVVFGWESMNEPNKGMIGYADIGTIPKEQALKKGTCPTIWQTMLTGSGRGCEGGCIGHGRTWSLQGWAIAH